MHECAAIYADGVLGVKTEPHKSQQSLLFKVAYRLSSSVVCKETILKRKACELNTPLTDDSLKSGLNYQEQGAGSIRRGYGF